MLKKIKSKLNIGSEWLILWATLYFGFVLNLAFWSFVFRTVEMTNFSLAIFGFSLFLFVLSPLYCFFNFTFVPYIGKPLMIFLLLISSTTNYLMISYGVYIDKEMIRNVFETNSREALDLVTVSGVLWVFITGVIPAILIGLCHVRFSPLWKEVRRRLILVTCTLLLTLGIGIITYKDYASFGRNNRSVTKILNTANYINGTYKYSRKQMLANRQFIILDSKARLMDVPDTAKTVLIYVVGETARAANFSLGGYERKTNPQLEKQDIVYFKDVSSCGTATATSVPCMFSNMTRAGFDANDAKYMENILDLAQTAKHDIIWRENDDGCKGVCDRVVAEDMVQTKHPKYCKEKYCHDEVLLDGLEERLKNITRDTVIVLHTMGSHGPTYYNRYPDEFKKFTPTCDTADIQNCSREAIVNTYDNTILYTDHVVSSAIDILKKFPQYEAGLLYVSDHGESLGENNIYLHGLPYNIAPQEQTQVPMLFWASDTMKKLDYLDYECLKKKATTQSFSHDNLFSSILGLLEIDSKTYRPEMDIFKTCRTKDFMK